MNGFQSLRCLWKHLDRKLQAIIVKFWKLKKLTTKITFANYRHDLGLSRGKIWLWLYIRLYFGAGRGEGWERVSRRVGGAGGRGVRVVGTCWLFKVYGLTVVTWAMTAYLGLLTAAELWQL